MYKRQARGRLLRVVVAERRSADDAAVAGLEADAPARLVRLRQRDVAAAAAGSTRPHAAEERHGVVGDEEEVLLELVCARDGRSLYCAGDDARCVADDTVPLFRRAWNRAASGGRGDVALTQTDETGRRVRLEARDGRVVCAPALGDDDAEQAAAGAAWRFAKARGLSLIHI